MRTIRELIDEAFWHTYTREEWRMVDRAYRANDEPYHRCQSPAEELTIEREGNQTAYLCWLDRGFHKRHGGPSEEKRSWMESRVWSLAGPVRRLP